MQLLHGEQGILQNDLQGSWMCPSPLPLQPLKIFNPKSSFFFFFNLIIAAPAAPGALSNVEMALRESCQARTLHGFPHKVFPLSGGCSHAVQAGNLKAHLLCWPCPSSGHCLHVLRVGTLCVAPALNWEGNIFPCFLCPLWTFPLWNMRCIVGFVGLVWFFSLKELTGNRYFPSDMLI